MSQRFLMWNKLDKAVWGTLPTKVFTSVACLFLIFLMVISGSISYYTIKYTYQMYYNDPCNRTLSIEKNLETVNEVLKGQTSRIEGTFPNDAWFIFTDAQINCVGKNGNPITQEVCFVGMTEVSDIHIIQGDALDFSRTDEVLVPSYLVLSNSKKVSGKALLGKQITIPAESTAINLTVVGVYDKFKNGSAVFGPNEIIASTATVGMCSNTLYPDGRVTVYYDGKRVETPENTMVVVAHREDMPIIQKVLNDAQIEANPAMTIYPVEIVLVFSVCFVFCLVGFIILLVFLQNTIRKLLKKQQDSIVLFYILGQDCASIQKLFIAHFLGLFIVLFLVVLIISQLLLGIAEHSLFQYLFSVYSLNGWTLILGLALLVITSVTAKRQLKLTIEQELINNDKDPE
ncbi:MAG: hypothetical protein PUA63_04720 [Oscillospiraceae bacterium]|nr:hypothetical protein [Oscillospiraceae bacterium]